MISVAPQTNRTRQMFDRMHLRGVHHCAIANDNISKEQEQFELSIWRELAGCDD